MFQSGRVKLYGWTSWILNVASNVQYCVNVETERDDAYIMSKSFEARVVSIQKQIQQKNIELEPKYPMTPDNLNRTTWTHGSQHGIPSCEIIEW